jgi:hypothetical protein
VQTCEHINAHIIRPTHSPGFKRRERDILGAQSEREREVRRGTVWEQVEVETEEIEEGVRDKRR